MNIRRILSRCVLAQDQPVSVKSKSVLTGVVRLRAFRAILFVIISSAILYSHLKSSPCTSFTQTTDIRDWSPDLEELADTIYREALAKNYRNFLTNGGIKDNSQVSAGHGSKVRIWDYYAPIYNCPSKERVGNVGDGGKWVCGVRTWLRSKVSDCVIYSFGSKGEVSFETDVKLLLPHCELHIFDPTLTPEQKRLVSGVPNASFHDYGIADKDGFLNIESGRRLSWVQKTKSVYPVKSLDSIMRSLGHKKIDIIKMDIEGGEWSIFEALFAENEHFPCAQILVELHFLGSVEQVVRFFSGAMRHGFRVFSNEPNYYGRSPENARTMVEYSLLQVK